MIHPCDRQRDRQTDGRTDGRTGVSKERAIAYMLSRAKKCRPTVEVSFEAVQLQGGVDSCDCCSAERYMYVNTVTSWMNSSILISSESCHIITEFNGQSTALCPTGLLSKHFSLQ